MDRFFPVTKAVETVTVQDLVVAILFFRCADIFSGKRRETAYNLAQKSAAFLQKRVLASQQRLLCRAAKRGSADHCRILPYELHAIRHIVQKWTAEPPEPILKNWSWGSPTPVPSGPEWA